MAEALASKYLSGCAEIRRLVSPGCRTPEIRLSSLHAERQLRCLLSDDSLRILSHGPSRRQHRLHRFTLKAERLVPTAAEVVGNGRTEITDEWAPSRLERGLATMMFVLPFSEGVFRLTLATCRLVRRLIMELVVWSELQQETIRKIIAARRATDFTVEDVAALGHMGQGCKDLCAWISRIIQQLTSFSPSAGAFMSATGSEVTDGWAFIWQTLQTPSAWWECSWLLYMCLLAAWALSTMQAQQGSKLQEPRKGGWLRLPELILASNCCALLLRLSFAPLEASSRIGRDVYRHGAVLLTLAATCTAAAQAQQVQCATLTKANVRGIITTLLDQAGNIAFMQASLLCLDWALLLFSPQPLSQKASFGAALALLVAILLNIRELGTLALEGISRRNRFL